jgi:hypothetical protein|tara:strand:+ start:879 stop:1007 length:129 start_codon:yes stop_codon:yes gene_type:complete
MSKADFDIRGELKNAAEIKDRMGGGIGQRYRDVSAYEINGGE